jgi:hypothetical protein
MKRKGMNRRRFLRVSLGAGAGIGALMSAGAAGAAGTLQHIAPTSPLGLDLQNRCGGPAEHAQLLAELQARLADGTGATGTTLSATAQCPLCGCPVTAYRTIK